MTREHQASNSEHFKEILEKPFFKITPFLKDISRDRDIRVPKLNIYKILFVSIFIFSYQAYISNYVALKVRCIIYLENR